MAMAGFFSVFKTQNPQYPFKMLLIGETGSGKTSFLNLLCNCGTIQALGCGFGADGIQHFRQFHDLGLENKREEAMDSKTNDAKRYNVEVGDLKVGIIDTPGFGDSRGLKRDGDNAKLIVTALKSEEYINCVCLIINGRQSRASASLKYVLSEITAILPKQILDSVIVVFSNTSDPLELNFDPNTLKKYFSKKVEHMFFIENPYCKFERIQSKIDQLGIDLIASSLQKAFSSTAQILEKMCTTIKDFPQVHTHQFIELYEKKQAIERKVFHSLTEYDNQKAIEEAFKKNEEEVEAALKTKQLHKDFRSEWSYTKWNTIPTTSHNTLCAHSDCHSNCHVSCSLPKSLEKGGLLYCGAIDGVNCRKCGHHYAYHHHDEVLHYKEVVRGENVDSTMKAKFQAAKTNEERAQILLKELEEKKKLSAVKRKQLSEDLFGDICEFQTLGIARNYVQLMQNQLDMIKTHLKGSVDDEKDDLRKTKTNLEKKLDVVRQTMAREKLSS